MTSKQLINLAMTGQKPPRPPVMCQLALGHIYKNLDISPFEFWYTSKGLAQAYVQIADIYHFDGILVSKPGFANDAAIAEEVVSIKNWQDGHLIIWKNGTETYCPPDDDPRNINSLNATKAIDLAKIDIETIKLRTNQPLSQYYLDPLKYVIAKRGTTHSIHGEVGTAFEQFLLLCGTYESGLLSLVENPDKCTKIMHILNDAVIAQARAQCQLGIDALKLSSPFAGAGFISRQYYETFVLPFEKEVINSVHTEYNIPCYIHTCGAIGDRLDLMLNTNADGLECLDPPPLGSVDLAQAVNLIGKKVFIKGNLDSVNELMESPEKIRRIVQNRLKIGMQAKGYILSSACSISPKVPPENVAVLHQIANEYMG